MLEEKKVFEMPTCEIVRLSVEDVITESGGWWSGEFDE